MNPHLRLLVLLAAAALCRGKRPSRGYPSVSGRGSAGVRGGPGPAGARGCRGTPEPRLRRLLPPARCAAGRGAALPLRADRVRGDPAAAPGPPGVPRWGTALRRARGHVSARPRPPRPRPRPQPHPLPVSPQSHDQAGTDGLPEPRRTLGQAPGHQDPPQVPAGSCRQRLGPNLAFGGA